MNSQRRKTLQNQMKTVGRIPKLLVLIAACSLVLPIFSYTASATVNPSASLSSNARIQTRPRPLLFPNRVAVPRTHFAVQFAANGLIRLTRHYSAALYSPKRHHRATTTRTLRTEVAPTTTTTFHTATAMKLDPTTIAAVAPTTTKVAPNSTTTDAPAPAPTKKDAPTTTTRVAPTTTTTKKVAPTTTTTTRVAPTTTTTTRVAPTIIPTKKVAPTTTTTTRVAPTTTTSVATTTTTPAATTFPLGIPNSAEPSGYAPPSTSALPGFTQSGVVDFTGTTLPAGWSTYAGQPGGDPGATYGGSSHVTVGGGILSLNTFQDAAFGGKWATGGVCQCGQNQTYGAYFVRSRVTGPGPTNVELMWPSANVWPPEIDFNETGGATAGTSATVHWISSTNSNAQEQRRTSVDMTKWNTWGIVWTPTTLTYTLDGAAWGTVTNSNEVPTMPMHLSLQQQTWCNAGYACPTSPESMQIDWTANYTFN